MTALWNSLLLVVVGEMGDKTQLLAMAMASRYRATSVMLGVLFATVLNHALAVLVGSYLSNVLPLNLISIVAAISFLAFGLWTLRGDSIDEGKTKVGRFGSVVTVGIAFFLAEMGDKTQLMTVTMAAEYRQPLWVLTGTTTGMLIADGIGVLFGAWICTHIPQTYMKWGAGLVFMFFGSLTLYNQVPDSLLSPLYVVSYLLALAGLIYLFGVRLAASKQPCDSVPTLEEEKHQPVASRPGVMLPK
jgi:putative Ca2+/H+ antiporter (TMEM165/GDT1 family)